eukprot:scaffold529406_cov34-Prasinocladus_malaysianus.AAC.1
MFKVQYRQRNHMTTKPQQTLWHSDSLSDKQGDTLVSQHIGFLIPSYLIGRTKKLGECAGQRKSEDSVVRTH